MSAVAIIGAGPIGAATTQRLLERGRVREIRLIDSTATVASGKALDLMQSGPIAPFDARVVAVGDTLAAAAASAIVIADAVSDGEWYGDRGRALLGELTRAGSTAPIVFAGARQLPLMEMASREFGIAAHRLVATAPSAVAAAVRSLAAIELDLSDVEIAVVGCPPRFVIGWSAAASVGSLLTDRIPPHRLLALSQSLPRFWPPGPYASGSATARVVEALIHGSRHLLPGATVIDNALAPHGRGVLLPLRLGRGRVLEAIVPSLSAAERTDAVNSFKM
jgi:malate dehydrogenase